MATRGGVDKSSPARGSPSFFFVTPPSEAFELLLPMLLLLLLELLGLAMAAEGMSVSAGGACSRSRLGSGFIVMTLWRDVLVDAGSFVVSGHMIEILRGARRV